MRQAPIIKNASCAYIAILSAAVIFGLLITPTVRAAQTSAPESTAGSGTVVGDTSAKTITMTTGNRTLLLRLNYDNRCILDKAQINGHDVISAATGVYTGITAAGTSSTTQSGLASPTVDISDNLVRVSGISYAAGTTSVKEQWTFNVRSDRIDWIITRSYETNAAIDDTAFPAWNFSSMDTWTGGMLNTGGVAWCRLIPSGYSYGAHADTVNFWNPSSNDVLRIATSSPNDNIATRFSNPGSGTFTFDQSVSGRPVAPKYDLSRFHNTLDLWVPLYENKSTLTAHMTIQALHYNEAYNRGEFKGIDGTSVTELLNTIARYGDIDRHVMGGNGWVSGYCCMHEPFFGEMGIGVDDPAYTSNLQATIDDWRTNALKPDGRVMARWCYDARDNCVPGTYNTETGYYDCGWGYLLDAQPDYVINTSEEFDLNGNLAWLRSQKEPSERALNWMLARDFDHSGLMTMMTDSHTAAKSSDWIDIIYACGKNALVNEEMYYALNLWADRETLLGDNAHALRYRAAAQKLKAAFIRPISEGGFWNTQKGYFDYWLEKDGSAHGDNLVTPVNFCAVAYGICGDSQKKSILDNIDSRMQKEKLFHWPLCFTSYKADECRGQMPFPEYENGDIFLSWGEVAVRSYASYRPEIAVQYVRNILEQYRKDGLSYQRYLRNSQLGAGNDILAGNSMTIVGLYRDIYGVRPQWNRLMLAPHLTPELYGTTLKYKLRDQQYDISLERKYSSIAVNGYTVQSPSTFAVSSIGNKLTCYNAAENNPTLVVTTPLSKKANIDIATWPTSVARTAAWIIAPQAGPTTISQTINGLQSRHIYHITVNKTTTKQASTNAAGTLSFTQEYTHPTTITITP
jgi:hypothetical protein